MLSYGTHSMKRMSMLLPLAALNVYYTRLLRSVLDGIFTTAQIALARQRIEEGGFNVFDGVLETNDGRRIGEAGKTLADAVIFSTIDWYYRTVVE